MLGECTLHLERKRKVQGAGRDRGERMGEEGRGGDRRGQEGQEGQEGTLVSHTHQDELGGAELCRKGEWSRVLRAPWGSADAEPRRPAG